MDLSIFLAKALGIYFFIISLSMMVNIKQYQLIVHEIVYSPALSFISSLLALIVGILMVITII